MILYQHLLQNMLTARYHSSALHNDMKFGIKMNRLKVHIHHHIYIIPISSMVPDDANKPAVSIDSQENASHNNEDTFLKAVAHQPVSIAIDAEGCITGEYGNELGHGIQFLTSLTKRDYVFSQWRLLNPIKNSSINPKGPTA
ncbi:hypothetical protein DKX38_018758 [Salix brachista]|uniref:Uncharacterized protein n=1 Tax=Salix brachista TaxID=2182728 RepID=A0A5N5KPP2_9ROSI|nr:hypothetical protein DKX38_018758 [Salix brachista]